MKKEIYNTVMSYGLASEQEDFIMKKVPGCEFKKAGCGTDLIAIPADLLIVNPNRLDEEEKTALSEYYKEIEPSEVSLILTEECEIFDNIKNVYVEKKLFEKASHGNAKGWFGDIPIWEED